MTATDTPSGTTRRPTDLHPGDVVADGRAPAPAPPPAGAAEGGHTATATAVTAARRPVVAPRRRLRPGEADPVGYLPGLDGLRAVSVLAVLVYHAGVTSGRSWLPGGFLGVEVFFVISGYLITLLLVSEHAASGAISFRDFWLRRARRLLPALYAVLAAVALALATFARGDAAAVRAQLVAAVGYVTNWYLIAAGQSYFDVVGRPSPLQHLWSLAIEEQFYLVWPVVIWGLLRVTGRRVAPMAAVLGAGALASTVLMAALHDPGPLKDPSRVYYGTDTRAAALLLGGVLALAWRPQLLRRSRGARPAPYVDLAGAAAVVGLALAFALLHDYDALLYRGGFLLTSLLSLVAIAAASHPGSALGRVILGNRLLVALGRRSYGLYLWHWPVFVFTRPEGVDQPLGVVPTLVLRAVLVGGLTELSYRCLETPIRNGAIGRVVARLRAAPPAQREVARRRLLVAGAVLAGVLLPAGASLATAPEPPDAAAQATRPEGAPAGGEAGGERPSADPAVEPPTTLVAAELDTMRPKPGDDTVTVLTDSVLLGIKTTFTRELGELGWNVDYRGRPAIMLRQMRAELERAGTPVGKTVVVGLGYNTLWERDRARYDHWASRFDRDADELLATLSQLGAERFVWVTLREPSISVIPPKALNQYRKYAWFFPYTNERIRALADEREDVVIADWKAVSNREGVCYDTMHLTTAGVRLMIETIRTAARI